MRVIPPLSITDSMLTNFTVAEPDAGVGEAAYNAGTTYPLGVAVVRAATHRRYRSLQAGNTGNTPESSPAWWKDDGPTNRWAILDILRNTQSVGTSPMTLVLTPGVRVDAVAVLGSNAESVTVSMTSSGNPVYSRTLNMIDRDSTDWYRYFFAPFSTRTAAVLFDLPPYSNGVITVTLTRSSGDVRCGAVVIGQQVFIGEAEFNAVSDALNFSTVDRTVDGTAVMVQRRTLPKTRQRLMVDKALVNQVRRVRDQLNAVPAVWSGIDDPGDDYFEALLILGFHRQFAINLAHPKQAVIDLELEEV